MEDKTYPLIGICIPSYNKLNALKKAVESVLIQEYENYYLVISDDSTDDLTQKYIESLDNKKIKYYHNDKRKGATENTNSAIKKAISLDVDYIKLLYHDDYFTDNKSLLKIIERLKKTNADVIFTGSYEQYPNQLQTNICKKNQFEYVCQDSSDLFKGNCLGMPSVLMYKTCDCFFDSHYTWLLDIEFYIRLMNRANKIEYIYEPIMTTGHDGNQLTDYFYRHPFKMWNEKLLLFIRMKEVRNKANFIHLIRYIKTCVQIYIKYKKIDRAKNKSKEKSL